MTENFTSRASKIIREAAGHVDDWTKWDHALLDLAREADDDIEAGQAALREIVELDHYPDATIARKALGLPITPHSGADITSNTGGTDAKI